jgi:hypothetical protein
MRIVAKTVEIIYKVFEPGDVVERCSHRSALPDGVHEVVRFIEPRIPHELDGHVFVDGLEHGYSAEYIMLAKEKDDDS